MFKSLSLLPLVVLAAGLHFATVRSSDAGIRATGTLAVSESSEVAHVEKLFSGARWTHPAPTTWSSRLEVRWNARWENAPQYAV